MTKEQAKKLRELLRQPHPGRRRLRNTPVIERLMFRSTPDPSGCWLWGGARNTKGYGHIRRDNNAPIYAVHRVSYEAFVGPIPDGMEIDHLCGVRHCVNPEHLEVVDRKTNVNRGRKNQNHGKTHCIFGHPFDKQNTGIDKLGKRVCRTCARLRQREYRAALA